MAEVPDARKHHGKPELIGRFDDFNVVFAPAGLGNRRDAFSGGRLHTVGKRKECVGSENTTLRQLVCLLAGDFDRRDTRRLPAPDSRRDMA